MCFTKLWIGFLGNHGIGVRNLPGEDLLQFCGINQLSVMNSFYTVRRRSIMVRMWTHPGTKVCHTV